MPPRHGCNKAEIRVWVSNVGREDSYNPETYGDAIIMERVIYVYDQQAQSRHAVKNAHGRAVHHKGFQNVIEQKEHICNHFGIQVDNPTTILQQEEAKVFFTDNSPQKRYEYFIKGTLLHVALTEYAEARKDQTISQFKLEKVEKHKRKSEREEERLGRVHDLLLRLSKHDNAEMFDAKKLIAKAQNEEAEAQRLTEKIQVQIEKANRAETLREEKAKELRELEAKCEEAKLKSQRTSERVAELVEERRKASEDNKAAMARLRAEEQKLEEGKSQVPRLNDQVKKLENAIRAEKTRAGQSAQERDKRTLDLQKKLDDLNKSQEEWKRKIEEGGNQRRSLHDRMMELKANRSRILAEQSKRRTEGTGLAQSLKRLQQQMSQSRDVSRVFGVEFEGLMADIERNLSRFSAPPVGPVGRHVKLVGRAARERDLCDLIESDLGRGRLRSFAVKTMDDQRALQEIFKRHFHGRKPPNITKMDFKHHQVDMAGKRAASTKDFTVLMDFFQFDNDHAFNFFMAETDIANTLMLADQDQGSYSVQKLTIDMHCMHCM